MNALHAIKSLLNLIPRQHAFILAVLLAVLLISQWLLQPIAIRTTTPLTFTAKKLTTTGRQAEQQANTHWQWKSHIVTSGESLSRIFDSLDISANTLHQLLQSGQEAKSLTKIFPGHELRFAFDGKTLAALQYIPSKLSRIDFLRTNDRSYIVERIFKQPDIRLRYSDATINDSLFLAAQKSGVSQGMAMNLANIFSGVIDFVYDPRAGDSFTILFEEKYLDGKKIGNGNILVASYTNRGEQYTAYRYETSDGQSGYFNAEGASMRKPFLRAPLDFTRISSGFNLRRRHPVHKKIKAHRGIDYAAPRGTPVFAAGDGRVKRAGFSKANGNYVFIRHGPRYVTKYLHLHRRYVKTGQKIKQRTVIGTVGSTGYSTGPHLHYEFLVDGVHKNPRTVLKDLPSAKPLPKNELANFKQQVRHLQLQYINLQQRAGNEPS